MAFYFYYKVYRDYINTFITIEVFKFFLPFTRRRKLDGSVPSKLPFVTYLLTSSYLTPVA